MAQTSEMKPELYQCPYESQCKCSMEEPCKGCETWAEFMKKEKEKGVHLYAFLDMIDCTLVVKRFANQEERWIAQIEHCETKESVLLTGVYGTGNDPAHAIYDYVRQIKGKHIVINAGNKYRKEYHVPTNIYV